MANERNEARHHPGQAGSAPGLATRAGAFLDYLDGYLAGLQPVGLDALIASAGGPDGVAMVVVDLVAGFCTKGTLATPRLGALVTPVGDLFDAAWEAGVRRFATLRDAHDPNAPEFAAFAPHCIDGTDESVLEPDLARRPWAAVALDVPKNNLSAIAENGPFRPWIEASVDAGTQVVVVTGGCTDLCLYHAALGLRLWANASNRALRVVVPANLADTYDLPVDVAATYGIMPHDGDLIHATFLYHLRLNGVEVVAEVTR